MSDLTASVAPRYFDGIQVLRGVAALMVVYAHAITMRWGMGISIATANGALKFLVSGVDIFFVISGFIIARTASEAAATGGRPGALSFFLKRAARIYPAFWLVLVAAIVSSFFIKPGAGMPWVPSLGPDVWLLATRYIWYVPPAWSLYFEMHFYVLLTLVILIAPRHVIPLSLALIVLCGLLGASVSQELLGPLTDPLTIEFGLGIVVAIATLRAPNHRISVFLITSASIVLFFVGGYMSFLNENGVQGLPRVATFGIGSAFAVYAFVLAEFRGAKFSPVMQYFGAISYSLYICHHLLFKWLARVSQDPMFDIIPGPIQIAIWIGIAILISMALFELVEDPIRKWAPGAISRYGVDSLRLGRLLRTMKDSAIV